MKKSEVFCNAGLCAVGMSVYSFYKHWIVSGFVSVIIMVICVVCMVIEIRKEGINVVKTHSDSRFALKTLDEIRDSKDVILQVEKTDSSFSYSKKTAYLCEVVSQMQFCKTDTTKSLSEEVIRLNSENRQLRKKIAQLEKVAVSKFRNGGSL